jgi:hypothetical protein
LPLHTEHDRRAQEVRCLIEAAVPTDKDRERLHALFVEALRTNDITALMAVTSMLPRLARPTVISPGLVNLAELAIEQLRKAEIEIEPGRTAHQIMWLTAEFGSATVEGLMSVPGMPSEPEVRSALEALESAGYLRWVRKTSRVFLSDLGYKKLEDLLPLRRHAGEWLPTVVKLSVREVR